MEGTNKNSVSKSYLPRNNKAEDLDPETLRRKEKIFSLFIVGFGTIAFLFSLAFFMFDIKNPFLPLLLQAQEYQRKMQEQERLELLALQTKDTDNDGLVDYLETNKYKTSPYLPDSDGDGITDGNEVTQGTDPNCPEGQICYYESSASTSSSSAIPSLNVSNNGNLSITPQFIRDSMKKSGFSEEEVQAFSDTELMAEFSLYLKENPSLVKDLSEAGYDLRALGITVPTSTAATVSTQPATTGDLDLKALNISSIEDLKKLSGGEIRQLMIKAGASADLLSTVSDDELKTLFINQIETKLNNQ